MGCCCSWDWSRASPPLPLIGVMTVALLTALRDKIGSLSDLFGLAEFCYVVLLAGLAVFGAGAGSLDALLRRRWLAQT